MAVVVIIAATLQTTPAIALHASKYQHEKLHCAYSPYLRISHDRQTSDYFNAERGRR
jgi:hypothetical protein